MNISCEINDIIENAKSLALNLNDDKRLDVLKNDLTNATDNLIAKSAKYIIKAMPVPDAVKDILTDVSKVLGTGDLTKILSTTVKSTVREGLEMLGISTSSINSLMELKDIAKKGGLITGIKNAIETVANNFLKNNIVGSYVYSFFHELKSYVQSNDFMRKLDSILKKTDSKKDEFLAKCDNWFDAFKKENLLSMNEIAEKLNSNYFVLNRFSECVKQNNIIQNMTQMMNNKKGILSSEQQRLCEVI